MAVRSLITGGAGFVGSHLAHELLRRGEEVHILDDLSTGSIENVEHLKRNARFHYTIDSVHNEPVLAELIDRCDVVYHLAAAVGVRLIVESPVNTIETNVHGTESVLKVANKKKKKVLITSTSEVYGKSTAVPFNEDQDLVLGPTTKGRWSYACSKAIDEFLGIAYWHEKKLPVVIVRLFNTVGPRQSGRYGMVIPNFVCQALTNQPITVYGDGNQSRAFGYVEDVVKALADLVQHPAAVGQVFNIGNTEEITINDLAQLIKTMTRSKSEIIHIPYDRAYENGFEDMPRRVPDITKIRRLIGYEPRANLKDILTEVIASAQNSMAGVGTKATAQKPSATDVCVAQASVP
jgi:UDP-glucose 4-epimerase